MGPHTEVYDHYMLIVQKPLHRHRRSRQEGVPDEMEPPEIVARYSRVPKGLHAEVAFRKFMDDVADLGEGWLLLGIVPDLSHDHPLLVTSRGRQPNGEVAHMP